MKLFIMGIVWFGLGFVFYAATLHIIGGFMGGVAVVLMIVATWRELSQEKPLEDKE
jgi:MFS superfamily sulfate permease-like transporter